MKKKLNQNLLNEELKKFRLLSEYSFYTEEPKKTDDLILGSVDEADEDPNAAPAAGAPAAGVPDDSKTAANAGDAPPAGAPAPDAAAGAPADPNAAPAGDASGDSIPALPPPDGTDAAGPDAGGEGEVDIDVTQLVQGSKEATDAAKDADMKTSALLSKFSELESKVANMDTITQKIDTLEKEIVKRNPTPVEKLEMRSMDSFPYNIKLSDYFKEVEGPIPDTAAPEYVLRKDDIDGNFVDSSVKQSFTVPDDYEEEEIQ
jgi:hypothetical protein